MEDKLVDDILAVWEGTFKKGHLPLWIFLSLKESSRYAEEILTFIEENSDRTITCDKKSLYRALRRFTDLKLLEFKIEAGNGPDRKYYVLSPLGKKLLEKFIDKNIKIFFKPSIQNLLFNK